MFQKATLKNISAQLSISISTVSRALKNHPDISPETKKRVTDLAKLIEYEPNGHAVSLRTSNSRVMAIMVPEISNYFYHSFISSVEEEARKTGYTIIILQSADDHEIETENLRLCRLNRIAGIFVCPSASNTNLSAFLKLEEYGIQVIFFDKVPDYEACNKVSLADASAASLAADVIQKKKKKKILGLFGKTNLSITQRRLKVFEDRFPKTDRNTTLYIEHVHSSDDAEKTASKYLSKRSLVDTIFCMSDEILTGVMKAINKKNLKIPDKVSIITISNGFMPTLYFPQITYVETSGYKLGKLAFSRMISCLNGGSFKQEVFANAVLIEGGSI
ncbi:MAG: LacI family DNA-binding transcriptional regulator [Bacteroidetes bacterium]|nr:LacI family DNA-binding transcriptional regulator [Bacteroidota bacterium]